MKKLYKVMLRINLFLFIFTSPIWSGTTGKIAGIVKDKSTGEPLFGASVVVVGTQLGAATDIEGQYTILHVPPGIYNVAVSFIGYTKVTLEDVRVFIDQTARIDVELESQAVNVGEMVVLAERNPIKPDVATSVVSVSGEELENLPIANVQDVLGFQAGINITNGGRDFEIRGGGGMQSLYMVDGVTMRDPRNNAAVTKVALSTVKEISIERGGFNAEYGQVQAGIVNIITNEGQEQGYAGNIIVRVAPPAPKYYRGNGIPDVQDPNSYWMRPYLDDAVAWTGTTTPVEQGGWDEYTRNKYPTFVGWNAISEQLNTDNDPNNDLTPFGAQRVFLYETRKRQRNNLADYEFDAGFGGPVPVVSKMLGNLRFYTSYRREREALIFPMTRPDYIDYDWRMVVNSDISESMRLKLSGSAGMLNTMEDNWVKNAYKRTPGEIAGGTGGSPLFNMFSDWMYSLTDISHRSFAGKLIHNINPSTYYEVSVEYFRRKYESYPNALRDTSQRFEIVPGYFQTTNPQGYAPWANTESGIIVYAGEQASLARDNSVASSTTLKADLISQINFNNLMKGGIEFVYNDLNLDYGFIQMQTSAKSYGSRVQMQNYPIRAAAYLQDKLETKGFTLNVGVRLDYSNSRAAWWDYGNYDKYFISSMYKSKPRSFPTAESEAQWQLSPRLGISHPISENAKLFFNYGHFKQMPSYEGMFRYDRRPDGTLVRIGDPNITLEKTISYELGIDYILPENILLQLTAYYKDLSNRAARTNYFPITSQSYEVTTSNDYMDVRGIELSVRRSAGRWFSGFANMTYQVASNGTFGKAQIYEDPKRQTDYNENTTALYQQRYVPVPNARVNLTFYSPDDYGPKFLNHHILGGWLVNFFFNWGQGGYGTYNPNNVNGVVNNIRYVDYIDGTLRVGKSFDISRFSVQVFADVTNVFNQLRLRDTGDQAYRRSLHLPKNKGYDNIPGEDKFGDYRKPGVEWVPMEYRKEVDRTQPASKFAIFYEGSTGKYLQYKDDEWSEVEQSRVDQILKDKAYIDMAGPSTYWFLNPRAMFFGVRMSFNF